MAAALAAAFQTDPVVSWLIPADNERERRMPRVFGMLARRFHVAHGYCYVAEAEGRTVGASIWDPPGRWKVSTGTALLALPELVRGMRGATFRGLTMSAAYDKVHPEEPHFYLADLGTRPESQGQGVGAALMSETLAEVDRHGLPAYLESTSDANTALLQSASDSPSSAKLSYRVGHWCRQCGGPPSGEHHPRILSPTGRPIWRRDGDPGYVDVMFSRAGWVRRWVSRA